MADLSLTHWLVRLRSGDSQALDRLLPMVYEELRALAGSALRGEDAGHTLNSTALVHEAYLRLVGGDVLQPVDRHHFFAIAARSMRRVLIDYARTRKRKKRGSGAAHLPLEDAAHFLAAEATEELVALDRALEKLEEVSPRTAEVVEHRFFAGLTFTEIADSLGVSRKTVQRDWLLGRAWLRKELDLASGEESGGTGEVAGVA